MTDSLLRKDQPSESAIIRALALDVCQRCTRKVVAHLRSLKSDLSGEDSGLLTMWDEICVQVQQQEESFFWDVYVQTTRDIVESFVIEMPAWHREAVWFQTEAAIDWRFEDEERREPYPVNNHEIVNYLLDSYIWNEAGRWSNKRIQAYIDRGCSSD